MLLKTLHQKDYDALGYMMILPEDLLKPSSVVEHFGLLNSVINVDKTRVEQQRKNLRIFLLYVEQ